MKTPREVAETLATNSKRGYPGSGRDSVDAIEAAIAADRRALLAEDEATIEAIAIALCDGEVTPSWLMCQEATRVVYRKQASAALAALRRLRGVE